MKPPDEPAAAADVIPGRLSLREDDGFVTVRLIVHGAKVEYKDGVFELKLPKQ